MRFGVHPADPRSQAVLGGAAFILRPGKLKSGRKENLTMDYKVRRSISTIKTRRNEVIPKATVQPTIKKIEIYEALYGLNAGIQQFLNSLDFLDRSGLGIPFLNGYRILADEIRSAVNFSTTEAMTVIELLDYEQLEKSTIKIRVSPEGQFGDRNRGIASERLAFSQGRGIDYGIYGLDDNRSVI
jgi:hypothetical protein